MKEHAAAVHIGILFVLLAAWPTTTTRTTTCAAFVASPPPVVDELGRGYLKLKQQQKQRLFVSKISSPIESVSALDGGENQPRGATTAATTSSAHALVEPLSPMEATIRKVTMVSYIASMCIVLPLALLPLWILSKTTTTTNSSKENILDKAQRERLALDIGQFCASSLLFLMPFMDVTVQSSEEEEHTRHPPEPSIWVCNHTSMLDTFILLACDEQLRGRNKRPIKTIYWKGLEDNPICNLLFKLAGFIPVQMEANGAGEDNQYDKKSFLRLLKDSKQAFAEGFDLLILPEGQLNPWPEQGLLPVFAGAHKLSQMSGAGGGGRGGTNRGQPRPIRMVALHGCHKLWHADDSLVGLRAISDKQVKARVYPWDGRRMFETGDEFVETFRTVVGHFGATGTDLPPEELAQWLDGSAWKERQQQHQQEQKVLADTNNATELIDREGEVIVVKHEISKILESEKKKQEPDQIAVAKCSGAKTERQQNKDEESHQSTSYHP